MITFKDMTSTISELGLGSIIGGVISAIIATYIYERIKLSSTDKRLKIRKRSEVSNIVSKLTMDNVVSGYKVIVIYLIIGMAYIIFNTIKGIDYEDKHLRYIFVISLVINYVYQFIKKKTRNYLVQIKNGITKNIKRRVIFALLPSLMYISFLAIIMFVNNIWVIVLSIILFFLTSYSVLDFFSCSFKEFRYETVKIYFKNATPMLMCNREEFSQKNGFVCINKFKDLENKLYMYNENDISRIEYIGQDVEEVYQKTLQEKGIR